MTAVAGGVAGVEGPIRVLVAEDEQHLGAILEHFLRGRGYAVTMCRDGRSALQSVRSGAFDVALLDIVMPELDGLEVLRHLAGDPDPPQVIIITGNGTIDTAITAIRLGAYDYLTKPYRMAEIDAIVRRAWEKRELLRANAMLRQRVPPLPRMIPSASPAMGAAVALLRSVTDSRAPVLLRGEPGSGKTHLARWLHAESRSVRSRDAVVEITTRSLAAGGVAPSVALFGSAGTVGALALAERGTVIVDAWALDPAASGQLARALADGWYTSAGDDPAGGAARIPLEARVVVCDRTGVWARHVMPADDMLVVDVPPVRERAPDLAALVGELLAEEWELGATTTAPDVLPALTAYGWPGNVRELRTVLRRAGMLAASGIIRAADLRLLLVAGGSAESARGAALADLERGHIEAMLVRCNWHQARAAAALGISSKTLYRKMREYGFTRPRGRTLVRRNGNP